MKKLIGKLSQSKAALLAMGVPAGVEIGRAHV